MACDAKRTSFFLQAARAVTDLIGAAAPAREFLETLFDTARQQHLSGGMADRLAAAAATQKMKARAARFGIDLFPHGGKSDLPRIDVQFGWKAISDVLDAVEQGRPLSPFAADLQRLAAFRCLTRAPEMRWLWETPLIPATRQYLRQCWAADPARVSALVAGPDSLGDEPHVPWLRAMSDAIAADATAAPALSAATGYYLLLDEEGMLAPEERAGWAQALGSVAGLGISSGHQGARFVCPRCGLWSRTGHPCISAVAALQGQATAAAAVGLADPLYAGEPSDPSPMGELDRQLEPWLRDGREPPPGSAPALGMAAARAIDRAWVTGMAEAGVGTEDLTPNDEQQLRDATLRAPVVFAGRRCVWDHGALYEEATYRQLARWDDRRAADARMVTDDERTDFALALVESPQMLAIMAGRRMPVTTVRVRPQAHPELFRRIVMPVTRLTVGQLTAERCGCVYRCTQITASAYVFHRVRLCGPNCLQDSARQYRSTDPGGISCLDPTRPHYTLPEWPAPAAGGV